MDTPLKQVIEQPAPTTFRAGSSTTAKLILKYRNALGECILYDGDANQLLWTDIYGKEINILDIATCERKVYSLPKMLCAFGLLKDVKGYLFCWEDGFQLYDPINGVELGEMSQGESVNPCGLPTRLNDGRCCPSGKRFICGGYYGDQEGAVMKLFRVTMSRAESGLKYSYQLAHTSFLDGLRVTNSICWSPDGKTMYLADSPNQTIDRYDYCVDSGEMSNKCLLIKYDEGFPDGSCNDSHGNVRNAVWRAGEGKSYVRCITPEGKIIYTVNMPDDTSCLTCCCFGGPNLDILFVSSAHFAVDCERETNAGCVYAVKIDGVQGRKEDRLGVSS